MPTPRTVREIRSLLVGPVCSLPTTFAADGSIDVAGVRRIIDAGIEAGSTVSLLTAGDTQLVYLSDDEQAELARLLVEQVAGRALTVAATRHTSTRQAVRFAHQCRELGVDMLMPTAWFYGADAPDVDGLTRFYQRVAEVLPVMIVGFPPHAVLDALVDVPNVIAFKEDGSEGYAIRAVERYGERFAMNTGGTLWRHLTQWPYGCRTYFDCYTTFAPHVSRAYAAAVRADDIAAGRAVVERYDLPFFALNDSWPGGIQAVWRGALALRGLATHHLPEPARSLSDDELTRLRDVLTAMDLLREE